MCTKHCLIAVIKYGGILHWFICLGADAKWLGVVSTASHIALALGSIDILPAQVVFFYIWFFLSPWAKNKTKHTKQLDHILNLRGFALIMLRSTSNQPITISIRFNERVNERTNAYENCCFSSCLYALCILYSVLARALKANRITCTRPTSFTAEKQNTPFQSVDYLNMS